ncbi:MAG: UbiA family prenyltransferase [Chitinophagales bacterium]
MKAAVLRLYFPLLHKFSVVFTGIYLALFHVDVSLKKALPYLVLALFTAAGIAAFGYLLNDYFDRDADQCSGKVNLYNEQPLLFWIGIVAALVIGLSPWIWLPFNQVSGIGLVIEMFLFAAYAVPPLRLKERGWAGIVCDSCYAYVIPCLLAGYTFILLKPDAQVHWSAVAALSTWLLLLGMRNILQHQLADEIDDRQSKTLTLVTVSGSSLAQQYLDILRMLEWCSFALVLWLSYPKIWLLMAWLLYGVIYSGKKIIVNAAPWKYAMWRKQFTDQHWLNEFYEKYWAIIALLLFSVLHPAYLAILAFHLVVFFPLYKPDLLQRF